MTGSYTTRRAPGAILIGVFLASVTAFVLFSDVIMQGEPINTGHALALAALITALASFHMAWPQWRQGAYGSAAALVMIGLGATAYIVISSGARNAETAQAKTAKAKAHNDSRSRIIAAQEKASEDLDKARDAKAKECSTGKGPLCREATDRLAMAESALAAARAVAVPAEVQINGGYTHAAKVLAAVPFVTAEPEAIETRLELLLPFLAVLIVELGTVTFLHVGLGHPEPNPPVSAVPHVEPVVPQAANDNVVEWVREFRARNGRNPQIPELQREFQLAKTTAWRRIKSA